MSMNDLAEGKVVVTPEVTLVPAQQALDELPQWERLSPAPSGGPHGTEYRKNMNNSQWGKENYYFFDPV